MSYKEFLDKIRQAVPDFDQIDSDPEFLEWTSQMNIDLQKIGAEQDHDRAIRVYSTWKRIKNQGQESRKSPAENQPQGKQTWTPRQIKTAYDRIARGEYSPEQADSIKQDIFQAQHEGRIIRRAENADQ